MRPPLFLLTSTLRPLTKTRQDPFDDIVCCQGHSHTEFDRRLAPPLELIGAEQGQYFFLPLRRGAASLAPIPTLRCLRAPSSSSATPRRVEQLREQHLEVPSPALPSTPQQMPSIIFPVGAGPRLAVPTEDGGKIAWGGWSFQQPIGCARPDVGSYNTHISRP
ncbi:hypothetical protein EDC01DRAFT_632564 [Geopyxis carbonaria]|nr:hypothetical protein EDC01DRAFT_632564 [Geopyxis carbonaria]